MSRHPNVDAAIEALEQGNSDKAWHLLKRVPNAEVSPMPLVPAVWTTNDPLESVCTHGGYFVTNGQRVEVKPGAVIVGGGLLYMNGKP